MSKLFFKSTLCILLYTHFSTLAINASMLNIDNISTYFTTSETLGKSTNGYIVIKTFYFQKHEETTSKTKQIVQDILSREMLILKTKIEIEQCVDTTNLKVSDNTKIIMQNIMDISNIPFNCNGFFIDNQKKIKIDIPPHQIVRGMLFRKDKGTLYYLSFQQGYIYQLPEEYFQPYFLDFDKEINNLHHQQLNNPTIVGYKISDFNEPKPTSPLSFSLNLPLNLFLTPDFDNFHFAADGDDDDPEPFPIPAPGIGKMYKEYFVVSMDTIYYRGDDDDPEPFPIPVPGIGKENTHNRQLQHPLKNGEHSVVIQMMGIRPHKNNIQH